MVVFFFGAGAEVGYKLSNGEDFAKSVSKSLGEMTIPYLENILYSLNRLNESMDKLDLSSRLYAP